MAPPVQGTNARRLSSNRYLVSVADILKHPHLNQLSLVIKSNYFFCTPGRVKCTESELSSAGRGRGRSPCILVSPDCEISSEIYSRESTCVSSLSISLVN